MNSQLVFLIVCLLFPINLLFGQNVVINPSFEDRNPDLMGCQATCAGSPFGFSCNNCCNSCLPPFGFSGVGTIGTAAGPGDALDWGANGGSSDFYLVGGTGGGAVPMGSGSSFFSDNGLTQSPRTGNAVGGIITYNGPANPEYREYLINVLSSPLVIGQQYAVEFYALLSNNSQRNTIELGAYFSDGVVPLVLGPGGFPAESSLQTHSSSAVNSFDVQASAPVSDNVNWTKICGVFTATTAATHLYIGNIKDAANTVLGTSTPVGSSTWNGTYYYIDDVRVEAFAGTAIDYCTRTILLSSELTSFEGRAIATTNQLTWTTGANSDMDDYFVVEKLEQQVFVPLATVANKMENNGSKTYHYEHKNPQETTTYYRLKQVSFTGAIQYSNIIALTNKNELKENIKFHPNPTDNQLFLTLQNNASEQVTIRYTNLLGVSILEEKIKVDSGKNSYELDHFQALPTGIYLVTILKESGVAIGGIHKIIKQ